MELALVITLNKTLVFTFLHRRCGCLAAPETGTLADASGCVEGLAAAEAEDQHRLFRRALRLGK